MKGPKYGFPVQTDFQKCREKIAESLNEFCNRRVSENFVIVGVRENMLSVML